MILRPEHFPKIIACDHSGRKWEKGTQNPNLDWDWIQKSTRRGGFFGFKFYFRFSLLNGTLKPKSDSVNPNPDSLKGTHPKVRIPSFWPGLGRGDTPFNTLQQLYGYVPPNGVVFLGLRFVERGVIFQMHESFKILSAILTAERGIKKLPIFRTGYHFGCKSFLKRCPHLEAWAAHIHPKPTRIPLPPRGGGGGLITWQAW